MQATHRKGDMHQKTLRKPCEIRGIGLHSGREAWIALHPAPADHGVVFRLHQDGRVVELPARARHVTRTHLSTCLGHDGARVDTVEHLLAALAGLEVDNVLVEVQGGEVPVLDGSSQPFVTRLRAAGLKPLSAPKRFLRLLEPIRLGDGDREAALYPSAEPAYFCSIDFAHPAVGRQALALRLSPRTFVDELAAARTFGFEEDLYRLRRRGLALGGSLHNAVGLGRDGSVLNPEGLRFADEFVRHKLLDAVGDLALAEYPILAEYRGVKAGHSLNLQLVQTLLERPGLWEMVESAGQPKAQAG